MEAVLNLLPEPPGVEHVVIDFEAAIYIQLLMISFYIYKLNSLNKMKTCRQNSNSLIIINQSIVNVLIMLAVYRHVADNWLHLRGTLVNCLPGTCDHSTTAWWNLPSECHYKHKSQSCHSYPKRGRHNMILLWQGHLLPPRWCHLLPPTWCLRLLVMSSHPQCTEENVAEVAVLANQRPREHRNQGREFVAGSWW